MSIVADMKPLMLQVKTEIKTPSGACKETWLDVKNIDVALYLTNDMKYTQSIKYNSSSHIGLTFYRDIDKNKNRFKHENIIYDIIKVNPKGRLTTLLLKVVDTNV
ncbi:MAG: hypothetical protein RSA29_17720 [Clostridium sp.]|uniref:hypothetical protein n=1 Tax=Clostridium sp. TaxID=1506 RepID=UPI00306F5ED9